MYTEINKKELAGLLQNPAKLKRAEQQIVQAQGGMVYRHLQGTISLLKENIDSEEEILKIYEIFYESYMKNIGFNQYEAVAFINNYFLAALSAAKRLSAVEAGKNQIH